MDAPTDLLVRARSGVEMRSEGDGLPTLFGHFAVFARWTTIDSWYEGRFLEQIAAGAFAETFREHRDQLKVLFDHGHDPTLGSKPLGPISDLREDKIGGYYEVPLIDTDYNRNFIVPAVEAGLLGASFRFEVTGESWDKDPGTSERNPQGLPERTITEVNLREFGPVTFPAYPDGTTAGLRSLTDHYIEHALRALDPDDPALVRAVERHPILRNLNARPDASDGDGGGGEGEPTEEPSKAGGESSGTINRYQALARLVNL